MADLESPRLKDCYSFGARGGPMFSTEVVKTQGGQAYANANWLQPLHVYDISAGVKTEDGFAEITAFFYNVGGRRDAFRFKDWADYRATRQPLTLVSGSIYQLNTTYVSGARTFIRPINKPVAGKVAVFRNGGSISPTIDTATGQVTVAGHTPGDVYTWTGEFDVRVAFVNDQLERTILNKGRGGLLINWPTIQLEERRL